MTKPVAKPACANFSSGPCAKHPGFELAKSLADAPLGRSHRAEVGKSKIGLAISETHRLLGLPKDYLVGIVPGSDTGAFEMAMWTMLGPRPVDVFSWESFGEGWMKDITTQLPLDTAKGGAGVRVFHSDFGKIPELSQANPEHDIVFTFNGTTSGVRVPNLDWIATDRQGLSLCDATSGIFAMEIDWAKVDVVTYSWQKVLGGEAAHGMLILSPRAVARLESYTPSWPLPKVFRLTNKGKLDRTVFENSPINTPSMLCVEDYIDALKWADSVGGVPGLIAISRANLAVLEDFVGANPWIQFLAEDPATRSNTSVCLSITDSTPDQVKKMTKLLEKEGVAYDIGSYKDAPPGIRIWCGATVATADLLALMPWLSWAHDQAKVARRLNAVDELVRRTGIDGRHVDDVIFGCVAKYGAQAANVARSVVLSTTSLPLEVPGTTVDRQCGSSQQAVHFAAQAVMSGTQDVVIAGGVEVMSLVPIGSDVMDAMEKRRGAPNGRNIQKKFAPVPAFSQFEGAEILAKKYEISRQQLDEFAVESHRRAAEATKAGRFKKEIAPITGLTKDGVEFTLDYDEGIRADTTPEGLSKLQAMKKPDGRITPGTSSQITDGASAMLIVNERGLKKLGLKPRARIVAMAVIGDDPVTMLYGPVPATKKVLDIAKLSIRDMDLYEVNEAFASVPMTWLKEVGADPSKLNVNGGAIALGHPLGSTGTKIMTTLLHEMERRGVRYGLQAICEGGGTANATIIENLSYKGAKSSL